MSGYNVHLGISFIFRPLLLLTAIRMLKIPGGDFSCVKRHQRDDKHLQHFHSVMIIIEIWHAWCFSFFSPFHHLGRAEKVSVAISQNSFCAFVLTRNDSDAKDQMSSKTILSPENITLGLCLKVEVLKNLFLHVQQHSKPQTLHTPSESQNHINWRTT